MKQIHYRVAVRNGHGYRHGKIYNISFARVRIDLLTCIYFGQSIYQVSLSATTPLNSLFIVQRRTIPNTYQAWLDGYCINSLVQINDECGLSGDISFTHDIISYVSGMGTIYRTHTCDANNKGQNYDWAPLVGDRPSDNTPLLTISTWKRLVARWRIENNEKRNRVQFDKITKTSSTYALNVYRLDIKVATSKYEMEVQ